MTYSETCEFLYNQLPMFESRGLTAIRRDWTTPSPWMSISATHTETIAPFMWLVPMVKDPVLTRYLLSCRCAATK